MCPRRPLRTLWCSTKVSTRICFNMLLFHVAVFVLCGSKKYEVLVLFIMFSSPRFTYFIIHSCGLHFCCFVAADLPLWQQTDGAIEWVQDYLVSHNLSLPKLPASNSVGLPDCVNSAAALSAESNEGIAVTASDLHDMYTGMFTTAFGIIREQQS